MLDWDSDLEVENSKDGKLTIPPSRKTFPEEIIVPIMLTAILFYMILR